MKRIAALLLLIAGLSALRLDLNAGAGGSALSPPSTGGLLTLDPLLRKLSTHRRLLVIGAHPDDEDTSLLTLVAGSSPAITPPDTS